jgi:ribosomal protein L30/L7E
VLVRLIGSPINREEKIKKTNQPFGLEVKKSMSTKKITRAKPAWTGWM